ncbi:hypothetical protein VTK26DRAFT_3380 [Humicola hyalothermophila]
MGRTPAARTQGRPEFWDSGVWGVPVQGSRSGSHAFHAGDRLESYRLPQKMGHGLSKCTYLLRPIFELTLAKKTCFDLATGGSHAFFFLVPRTPHRSVSGDRPVLRCQPARRAMAVAYLSDTVEYVTENCTTVLPIPGLRKPWIILGDFVQ